MAASKTISDKNSSASYKTITLNRLNEVYIRGCVPRKMVGQDGVIVDIKESWFEVLMILLSTLNFVHNGRLLDGIKDSKVSSPNMMIYNEYFESYEFGGNKCYRIPNSGYYIISNLDDSEYPIILKKLCKACGMDAKHTKLQLQLVSLVEQDIENMNKNQLKRVVSLENLKPSDLLYGTHGISYGSQKFKAKTMKGLVEILLNDFGAGKELESSNKSLFDTYKIKFTGEKYTISKRLDKETTVSILKKLSAYTDLDIKYVYVIVLTD